MNDTEKQTNNVQKAWNDDSILKSIYRKERQLLEFSNYSQKTPKSEIRKIYGLCLNERCELYYIARDFWKSISTDKRRAIEDQAYHIANDYLEIMFVLAIADYCVIAEIEPSIIQNYLVDLIDLSYQLQSIEASVAILKEKLILGTGGPKMKGVDER